MCDMKDGDVAVITSLFDLVTASFLFSTNVRKPEHTKDIQGVVVKRCGDCVKAVDGSKVWNDYLTTDIKIKTLIKGN